MAVFLSRRSSRVFLLPVASWVFSHMPVRFFVVSLGFFWGLFFVFFVPEKKMVCVFSFLLKTLLALFMNLERERRRLDTFTHLFFFPPSFFLSPQIRTTWVRSCDAMGLTHDYVKRYVFSLGNGVNFKVMFLYSIRLSWLLLDSIAVRVLDSRRLCMFPCERLVFPHSASSTSFPRQFFVGYILRFIETFTNGRGNGSYPTCS